MKGEELGKVWLERIELATGRKDYVGKVSGGAMIMAASADNVLVLVYGEVKVFSAHRPREVYPIPPRDRPASWR